MKRWITTTLFLFVLAGIVHAENTLAFNRQVIQVPVNTVDWVWPYWKDADGDGLTDLLALSQVEGILHIYNQKKSGFSADPTQTIEFPEGVAWFTLYDVSEHPGDEMLISTNEGLVYYRPNNGVFETRPEKLIGAKQAIPRNHSPIVKEPDEWPEDFKNTIPLVFADHTVIYKIDEGYRLEAVRKVEHEFKKTMDKYNWNSWSIGSKRSDQIRIRTIAEEESKRREEGSTDENEYIRKMLKKTKAKYRLVERRDIDNDGNKDVILLHIRADIDVKTNIIIFKRRQSGELPEKPDQILRCRGIPIIGDHPGSGHSNPFYDINNDGFSDIVFMEFKNLLTSVGALFEMLTSEGMDWILTVRLYKSGKGFSDRADFKMDFKTMPPFSEHFADLINIEGDFNADGRKDLIIKRSTTQSDIYVSSLSNGFFEQQPRLRLETPLKGRIFVEDLNNDGISDIHMTDCENGRIAVFLSEPMKEKGAF
ncbi:MAG: FG-GAP repeat domain-containing protein [Planctomycetota bacterium]|jgi:hypothetical protein